MNQGLASEIIRATLAVAQKEFASEFRSRSGPIATGMFVLVVSVVIAFALGTEHPSPQVTAALLWIAFFFTNVASLARSFTLEQDRGTLDFLRLHVAPTPVYFGKLAYNVTVAAISNTGVALLLLLFLNDGWQGSPFDLVTSTLSISFSMAAAMTIVSALLAHTTSRGALGAVLSLPLLMPVAYLGVELLATGAGAGTRGGITSDLGLLIVSYSLLVIIMSYILLDFIWEE